VTHVRGPVVTDRSTHGEAQVAALLGDIDAESLPFLESQLRLLPLRHHLTIDMGLVTHCSIEGWNAIDGFIDRAERMGVTVQLRFGIATKPPRTSALRGLRGRFVA
jgi:hypothetical protein